MTSNAGHSESRIILLAGHDEEFQRLLEVTLPGPSVEMVSDLNLAGGSLAQGRFSLVLFDFASAPSNLSQLIASRPEGVVWAVTLRPEESEKASDLVAMGVERIFYHPVSPSQLARQLSWLLRLEAPAAQEPEKPSLFSRQSELFEAFMVATRERVATIFQGASTDSTDDHRVTMAREAHKMVGTLGSFGFPAGSVLARQLEEILGDGPLSQTAVIKVTSLCQDLLDLIEGADPSAGFTLLQGLNLPLVAVITSDVELRKNLSTKAPKYSMRLVAPPLDGLEEFFLSASTDAVVFDFADRLPGLPESVSRLLRGLVCPVIALCPRQLSLKERVEISGLGVALIVEQPYEVEPLLENLRSMLALPVASRVLAIDDDPLYLRHLESLIVPLGTEFTGVGQAEALWLALEDEDPDLVLLDIDMPEIDGLALCRAIHSDPRFSEVPVVFITSNLLPEVRQAAYESGADDYIPKSIEGAELRIRIATRLRRARASRRAEADQLTGLLTRAPAVKALNHLLKLGERRSLPVCLAVVDLDHFKTVNDRFGHSAGDLVLRRVADLFRNALRSEDVVSRWGGEEFVTGMFLLDKAEAVARLSQALETLKAQTLSVDGHSFNVSFSAGVAEFPLDGRDVNELYLAADGALYQAKQQRSTVVGVATNLASDDRLDLVLVEDDHPLGSVLMEAFAEQGWRAVWFQDGADAATALLSEDSALNPRVIVIDRELPGLDGLGLVEWLSDEGVCRRSKVITVSAKMSDDEVQTVLKLGVFDHVPKPFSLSVLLRRISLARATR